MEFLKHYDKCVTSIQFEYSFSSFATDVGIGCIVVAFLVVLIVSIPVHNRFAIGIGLDIPDCGKNRFRYEVSVMII